MNPAFEFRIDDQHFAKLMSHLFPGDNCEHGAVVAAGRSHVKGKTRFLVRDVFLAKDGRDHIGGTYGSYALAGRFVAEKSDYCAREGLSYFSVHSHGGKDSVTFSNDDLAAHRRGYPALLDILEGNPVGALVFAKNAVEGAIWTKDGVYGIEKLTVVGPQIRTLYPSKKVTRRLQDERFDRQSRMFGDRGQELLSNITVGIIGLGGVGSLVSQFLSRLGIGKIIAIDYDRIEPSNLSRVVGATDWDAKTWIARHQTPFLKDLGKRLSAYKVDIAKRVARAANPKVDYQAIRGSLLDMPIAMALRDCDFLFLAADSFQARLVFNSLVHQYLIPGIQLGSSVTVDSQTGKVEDIMAVSRPVLGRAEGGCLHCHGAIPPGRLQEESLSPSERQNQRYVADPDIAAPSVITLNALAAAHGTNDFLMMLYGFLSDSASLRHEIMDCRDRVVFGVNGVASPDCRFCGSTSHSGRARGDGVRLPCKQ